MTSLLAQSYSSTSDAGMLGTILGIALAVVVCAAIPFTTGATQGKVLLGILGALVTIPAAGLLGLFGGLPVAVVCSGIIALIPKSGGPLLSRSEIEAELRRSRGA